MKQLILLFLIISSSLTFGQQQEFSVTTTNDPITFLHTENGVKLVWGNDTIFVKTQDEIKIKPEFLLSLGFNFDFLSGVKAKDLYADIDVDIPFAFVDSKKGRNKKKFFQNVGFEFGAYQMRTVFYY